MSGVSIKPAGTAEILARQLSQMRASARQAMKVATGIAHDELRSFAPGGIGEHVEERIGGGSGEITGTVFPTDDWARYVDEGTGVYVEFHGPIVPKKARREANPRAAMKLGSGGYRRRVRGQRGQHFIDRAAEAAESRVVEALDAPARKVTAELAS